VRNLVQIDRRSPAPGVGCWGCVVCGLPAAGALAVLCDECLERRRPALYACVGAPCENHRVPRAELTERFEHDLAKHDEYENEWLRRGR